VVAAQVAVHPFVIHFFVQHGFFHGGSLSLIFLYYRGNWDELTYFGKMDSG
jgi:hypothetical protein